MSTSNSLSLLKIISSIEERVPEFAKIAASPDFHKKLTTREVDDELSQTLSLVYLQQHYEPFENLDERVLAAVVETLEENELSDKLVDISINLLTWKRGDKGN